MINLGLPRLFHCLTVICALLIILISSPHASYACNVNSDCRPPRRGYCRLTDHTCQVPPSFTEDPLKFSWPYPSSNDAHDAAVQSSLDVSALPRNATD